MAANTSTQDINQVDADAIIEFVRQNGVTHLTEAGRRQLDTIHKTPLNICVTGNSGTGKSSLINTMRRLAPGDHGAAVVNEVEATTRPTSYADPNNANLLFWDVPGVGTPNFPRASYMTAINVDRYDFFLIVTRTRFTENDLWLANEINSRRKHFVIVRTCIDSDLKNEKRDRPDTFNEATVLREIREECNRHLNNTKIYLISTRLAYVLRWDFEQMINDLIDMYPLEKRHAIGLVISASGRLAIQKKVVELKKRIWLVALVSAGTAAVPMPGLSLGIDTTMCVDQLNFARQQLELDERSLHCLAVQHNISFADLKHFEQGNLPQALLATFSTLIIQGAETYVASRVTEEAARFVPLVGSAIAGTLSFSATLFILRRAFDQMEKDAIKLNEIIAAAVASRAL